MPAADLCRALALGVGEVHLVVEELSKYIIPDAEDSAAAVDNDLPIFQIALIPVDTLVALIRMVLTRASLFRYLL